MNRTHRHPAHSSARPSFALLSVLALLALACFPVGAHAIPEYETEIPGATGNKGTPAQGNPPSSKSKNSPDAESSTSPSSESGGTGPSGSEGGGSGGSGSPSSANNPSTGNEGGTGQGSQGNGTTKQQAGSVADGKPASAQTSDDGSSSSPLVPILIAIAALAAISIGAVVLRQRRRSPDGQISPKAS